MSDPILPLAVWEEGTLQNDIPANDNALRVEAMSRNVTAIANSPSVTTDGTVYIVDSSPTGAFSTFTAGDLTIIRGGNWTAWAPVTGVVVNVAGSQMQWNGSAWAAIGGSGSRSPAIQTVTSSATVTPTFDDDAVKITAQAAGLTLANPTGTPIAMLGMVIRIKDNGTARSITYGSQYRAIGVTLPSTTVISKTLYLAMIYNSDDTKWDVLAVGQEA